MRQAYPLLLDVSQRSALIVGGGAVAARKARGLLEAGIQRVCCVATEFHRDMPAAVQRLTARFEPGHVQGFDLVFAATNDPQVNDAVVAAARRQGALVNRADSGDGEGPGDFTVPACWRTEGLTIAVSAEGNPALAARLRDQIAQRIEPLEIEMAHLLRALRPAIQALPSLDTRQRQEIFRDLAGDGAFAALHEAGPAGLRDWLVGRYPVLQALPADFAEL